MARNWQYPRWRRLLMQLGMWGILGATVGLAALVDRHRHEQTRIVLGEAVPCGEIRLRLPRGGRVQSSSERPGLLTEVVPQVYPMRREILVTVAPPAEEGMLSHLLEKTRPTELLERVPFGSDGSLGTVRLWAGTRRDGRNRSPFIWVVATALLQDGPEVTIRSEASGMSGDVEAQAEADVGLVKAIAATIVRE